MRAETSPNESGSALPQKVLIGLGVVAAVVAIGLLMYFLRKSDPAAAGPIPYQKFDYGAHMQEQMKDYRKTDKNAAAGATK